MNTSFVSSVYFNIAPAQVKLNKDELWLLQNPEYHAIAQQISKDLKNESNSKLRRHTINIQSEPSSSTPKIISVERKRCSETCEKTCIRKSITEAFNYPAPIDIEHKPEIFNSVGSSFNTDVKSKINFFNQISSGNGRLPKAIPRRRSSVRNDAPKPFFQNKRSECQSHVYGKEYRVFKISSEDLAKVSNAVLQRNGDCPQFGTVKQNKQKFDHCLGSRFSEEKKIKRLSNTVELPITAVPVRLRIAEIERKCIN